MDRSITQKLDKRLLELAKPYEIVDEWVENEISVRKNPMTTNFAEFDEDQI